MNPSGTRQVHPLPMQSRMAPLQPLHPLQLLDSMEDSTESPWTPQRPARRRKTAWERRAQAMRTEGRAIGRLLKAVSSLSMHRGCQPTRLAAAFAYALEQPRQPAQDSTLQPSMEPSMAMSVDPAVPVDPAMHVEQLSGHGLQTQTVAAATGTEGPDLQIQTATDLQSGSSEDSASTADSGPRRPGDLWDPSEAYWSALLDASAEDWSRPAWATEGVDLQSAARLQSAESVFPSAEQLELRPSWEALETELPAYLQPVQPVDCENLYSSVETTRPKPGDCVVLMLSRIGSLTQSHTTGGLQRCHRSRWWWINGSLSRILRSLHILVLLEKCIVLLLRMEIMETLNIGDTGNCEAWQFVVLLEIAWRRLRPHELLVVFCCIPFESCCSLLQP